MKMYAVKQWIIFTLLLSFRYQYDNRRARRDVQFQPKAEAAASPDADAAADAWHGYYGYGRRWGGYYGGYYGHPYGYGYYRNKRSPAPEAEASPVAKPEANADAEAYDPKVEAEARTAAWYGYYGQRYNGYGQSYCPKFYRNCYGYGYYNHSG